MTAWAGPLHDLVPLRCLSSLREAPDEQATYTNGLSGRRRARLSPFVPRSWSCGIDVSDPSEVATLEEFYWAHRARAVWLVTEAAQVQNVLPPPARELDRARGVMVPRGWESTDDLTAAGAFATVDGPAAASVLVDGGGAVKSPVVPCVPGTPVTVSVYVASGGTVSLVWVDAAGAETTAATSGVGENGERVSVSATLTDQTACRLVVNGASVYARPQITWTAGPVPYVVGRGAASALFGPVSQDVIMALSDGSRNLSSYSYTITEVG